jgi:superfamily II DNA or RNA helicase
MKKDFTPENRDYQVQQIESTIEAVSQRRKVCVQLPTGGGKTMEFSLLAQRYTRNTDKAVLILVHRQELMYQAAKTIKRVMGIDPYLITSTTKHFYISRVYIGMVESTLSRMDLFNNVGLVIIDECHIANFNKVHNLFLEELIIGFSATPISSSKKEPLNKYYSCVITGPQISELIKGKFLAQNITRCPKHIVDSTQFQIDKLKGDYNERQMAAEYKQPKHITNVVKNYNRYCKGKKTIIFNVNIEHSKDVTECFQFMGLPCKHLDSNVGDVERAEILKWFEETDDAILCNVMIATVGFDEPTIRNVILNFSTLSLTKFIQCCGRGSRWLPGKDYFNIIDMGGNCVRFGDWNDDRDWDYIFNHPDRPGDGIAPVKTCPSCEGLVHAAKRVCDLPVDVTEDGSTIICGHEFARRLSAEEQDLEEMILITKGINIHELIYKNNSKYEYYTFLELAVDVVKRMYKENKPEHITENIHIKYFKAYYRLCIEWYRVTLAYKNGNIGDITDSAWHIKRARNNFDTLAKKLKPVSPKLTRSVPNSFTV